MSFIYPNFEVENIKNHYNHDKSVKQKTFMEMQTFELLFYEYEVTGGKRSVGRRLFKLGEFTRKRIDQCLHCKMAYYVVKMSTRGRY